MSTKKSLSKSIRRQPSKAKMTPESCYHLGQTLSQQGRFEEALAAYAQALQLNPAFTDVINACGNLGNRLQQQQQLDLAGRCYQLILQFAPRHEVAHNNLGNVYQRQERFEEACVCYQQAIQCQPRYVLAYNGLAAVYKKQGKIAEAITYFQKVLEMQPNYAPAYNNLGLIFHEQDQLEKALVHLQYARQLEPHSSEVWRNLGLVLAKQEKWEEACHCFRQALAFKPDYAEAHFGLGMVFYKQDQFEEARRCYQMAIELKPNYAEAYSNLGVVMEKQNQFEEAHRCYQTAIELKPNYAEAYFNLGVIFHKQDQFEETRRCYQAAIELKPEYVEAQTNLSFLFLKLGQLTQGWQKYLWRESRRHITSNQLRSAPSPTEVTALPQQLPDVRILLETEQGLGDELFFLRFAPLLKERGASWLAYRCGLKLQSLLQRVSWLDQVIPATDDSSPTVDYHWPIGDLPFLLGINSFNQIPPPVSLTARPELVAALQTRLNSFGPPPYLGITWWAGTRPEEAKKPKENAGVYHKSISLTDLSTALRPVQATIIILQRHPTADEIDTLTTLLAKPVYDLSPLNDNLEEMLALLSLLDDYVGVSNTNMYLLAGLGKTARVLVPHPSEWRWLVTGDESPWFPGFKVYRQTIQKDWSGALRQLTQDLMENLPKTSF